MSFKQPLNAPLHIIHQLHVLKIIFLGNILAIDADFTKWFTITLCTLSILPFRFQFWIRALATVMMFFFFSLYHQYAYLHHRDGNLVVISMIFSIYSFFSRRGKGQNLDHQFSALLTLFWSIKMVSAGYEKLATSGVDWISGGNIHAIIQLVYFLREIEPSPFVLHALSHFDSSHVIWTLSGAFLIFLELAHCIAWIWMTPWIALLSAFTFLCIYLATLILFPENIIVLATFIPLIIHRKKTAQAQQNLKPFYQRIRIAILGAATIGYLAQTQFDFSHSFDNDIVYRKYGVLSER